MSICKVNDPIRRPNLKVAAILDEFSYECFKYECHIIRLNIKEWEKTLIQEKPELLLVESAWKGNENSWQFKIAQYNQAPSFELVALIKFCNENHIPTVFWNKEDPTYFARFIKTAKLFDYIFTTDECCVPKYKKLLNHNHVYTLPFAAQPKIHNPIDRDKNKLGKIAFAGTYHRNKFPHRKHDMHMLLKPALTYGLHIYDRLQNTTKGDSFQYPILYQPFIVGNLPYKQMVEAYKKYDIFLNVNIVKDSPTMFSRRVFELLACGTNIISSHSVGIEKMFENIVMISNAQDETIKYLELLHNKNLRDQLSLLGQRNVFNNHTYSHRLETILEKVAISYEPLENPGVSVIVHINSIEYFNSIIANFQRQNYKNKELIMIAKDDNINLDQLIEKTKLYSSIKAYNLNKNDSLGNSLNFGISHALYDYICLFGEEHFYGSEFIGDLMNTFKYTNATVVGKHSYYTYSEKNKALYIKFPDMENRYTEHLENWSLIIKKEIFSRINFGNTADQVVDLFLKDCLKHHIQIYSADRFNYVRIDHELSNADCFLNFVANVDDYSSYVTV